MKSKNKGFSYLQLLFILLLILSLFLSGCSKQNTEQKQHDSQLQGQDNLPTTTGNEETTNLSESGLPLSSEPAELSIWYIWSSDYLDSPQDITAVTKMQELTNVKINYNLIQNAEAGEKYGLMLASGDYPDIIFQAGPTYPGGLEKGVEDGVLVDMTSYVTSIMPNYYSLIQSNEEISRGVVTDSGKYIGMYSLTCNDTEMKAERSWNGLVVRQDWLDRLNMELPVTIDDWTNMLEAFKTEIGCDYPLVIGPDGAYLFCQPFAAAYGVTNDFYLDGNTIKFGPVEPAYKDYLDLMASWFAAGYLDPNFTTGSSSVTGTSDDIVNNKCGVFPAVTDFLGTGYTKLGYETEEGFFLSPVKNPVLNAGDTSQYRQSNSIVNDCHAVVTTNCKEIELAAKWLDYQYTTDAMLLNNYGMENESYTRDDASGRYHLTDLILNNPNGYSTSDALRIHTLAAGSGNCIGLYNWQRMEDTYPEDILTIMDTWNSDGNSMCIPHSISMTEKEGSAYNLKYADLSTAVDEYTVNVILGNDSTDNFDSFVNTIKQLGVEECIAYQQAAYDRYLNR